MGNDYDISAAIDGVAGTAELRSEWSQITYESDFQSSPVTIASIQTFHGSNTAQVRMRNNGRNGVEMLLEEEQSLDDETGHEREQVGYISVAPDRIPYGKGYWVADVGDFIERQGPDSEWQTIEHDVDAMQYEPVAFAQLLTKKGEHPAHVRLRNVELGSFDFQIEEWDYLNQHHTEERIGYAVLTTGVYPLADGGVLEIGTTQTDHEWADVSLDSRLEGEKTVVVSQCQTYNGGQAVVTRHRNVSSSGFEVRLQEEEANDHHATETIGYAAVTPNPSADLGADSPFQ